MRDWEAEFTRVAEALGLTNHAEGHGVEVADVELVVEQVKRDAHNAAASIEALDDYSRLAGAVGQVVTMLRGSQNQEQVLVAIDALESALRDDAPPLEEDGLHVELGLDHAVELLRACDFDSKEPAAVAQRAHQALLVAHEMYAGLRRIGKVKGPPAPFAEDAELRRLATGEMALASTALVAQLSAKVRELETALGNAATAPSAERIEAQARAAVAQSRARESFLAHTRDGGQIVSVEQPEPSVLERMRVLMVERKVDFFRLRALGDLLSIHAFRSEHGHSQSAALVLNQTTLTMSVDPRSFVDQLVENLRPEVP